MPEIDLNDPNLLILKIEARNRKAEQIKKLEKEKKDADEEIINLLLNRGDVSFATAHWTATVQNRTTKTIKSEKLIALGVEIDTIEKATETSVSDPFLVVRPAKTKEREQAAANSATLFG